MFSSAEFIARAFRDLFETQAGFYARNVHAAMDAGVTATELNIDSIKTLLATSTVATRQWCWEGGVGNWLAPDLLSLSQSLQFAPPALPDPVRAAST